MQERMACLLAILALLTLLGPYPAAGQEMIAQDVVGGAGSPSPPVGDSTAGNTSLQFTASGHVLGFRPGEMYLVAADHMLKIELVGARAVAPISNRDSPLSNFQSVTYPDLWDGVTLTYDSSDGAIAKSTYVVAPSASIEQIRLRYNVPVRLDARGNLLWTFETGQLHESAPVAWQEIRGQRIPVKVAFRLLDKREVGFSVEAYDPTFPLIIDPELSWNTFLGGTNIDLGNAIAVDGDGNVYVAGASYASWGTPLNPYAGGITDAFVVRLNSSGARQWHTFLGSASIDSGDAIAVDGDGNVYVAGSSEATWGTPVNPHAGGYDAFVAQLNSSGARQWHTFMGGTNDDFGHAIAVDGARNVSVAGYSQATWGTSVDPHAGGADAFAAQLNSNGVRQWHTFLGGTGDDYGDAIAVNGSGSVYVAGDSRITWGTPVNPHAGSTDAFVAQLNSNGVRQWHTFLGSASGDSGDAIAVDGDGNVCVAGNSNATWGTPVNPHTGGYDAFVARLNSSGARQWHTFLGSADYDDGNAIAMDGARNVYVTGWSDATWGTPVNPHVGGGDAFVTQLNSNGARQWHTFLGGTGDDDGNAIAVDRARSVYVAGWSSATWGTPVNPYTAIVDAFAAKISADLIAPIRVTITGPITGLVNTSYTFTATVNPITTTSPITYAWQATEQSPVTHTDSMSLTDIVTFTWSAAGTQAITVTATNAGGTVTDIHAITLSVLFAPGDCNGDYAVDAGDGSAIALEIFDGDGTNPASASGGSFPGTPGCDANEDGIIDAGDGACIPLLILNGPGACNN